MDEYLSGHGITGSFSLCQGCCHLLALSTDNPLPSGAVLCIVGYSVASLVSAHLVPVACLSPSCDTQICLPRSPGGTITQAGAPCHTEQKSGHLPVLLHKGHIFGYLQGAQGHSLPEGQPLELLGHGFCLPPSPPGGRHQLRALRQHLLQSGQLCPHGLLQPLHHLQHLRTGVGLESGEGVLWGGQGLGDRAGGAK